jgi:type III pantothenate kinase
MKNFLIDIGNSAIKTCTAEYGSLSLSKVTRNEYDKKEFVRTFESSLRKSLQTENIKCVGISLLDRKLSEPIRKIIRKLFGLEPLFISTESKLPFQIRYANTIGSDRLCSSAAAFMLSKSKTILIIDFGTATTYTVINNSKLIGGMISPGVGTSYNSLISNTNLPVADLKFPKNQISSDTPDNISGGVLYQSLYTTERFINETFKNFGETHVFCTGGYSKLIMSKTALINKLDRNLVLKGINIIISR